MRAAAILIIFFVLIAAIWAVQMPLTSFGLVRQLGASSSSVEETTQELIRAGNAAVPALMQGLKSESEFVRLRCARVLALRGERAGDRCLFEILHRYGREKQNSLGALAEGYLLAAWEQRDGPRPELREKIKHTTDSAKLSEFLDKYPGWSAGHLIRAKLYLRNSDGLEARRYALISLMLEPDSFDAMATLAQAHLLLDNPEQAYTCLQQAVRLNPRLKETMRDDIDEILKGIEIDRARRRRERRKEIPII